MLRAMLQFIERIKQLSHICVFKTASYNTFRKMHFLKSKIIPFNRDSGGKIDFQKRNSLFLFNRG